MKSYKRITTVLCLCIAGLGLLAQTNKVCITIDDLPIQRPGKYPAEKQKQITGNLLANLKKYRIPAIGFVNENKLYMDGKLNPDRKQMLVDWLENGQELGNHTFSHPDYDNFSFAEFSREIPKGQLIIGPLGIKYGKPVRYFRHPYLHRGNNEAKVDSLANYLKSIGLTEAPVTIDNSEWIFAFAYDSALSAKDTALQHSIGNAYIPYMEAKVHYFERQSAKLFGRNINQILLIHANALNGDYLGDLARMFIKNGYQFISLEDALKDEAYKSTDTYYRANGISWMDRWALTRGNKGDFFAGEPVTPEFIMKMAKLKYE